MADTVTTSSPSPSLELTSPDLAPRTLTTAKTKTSAPHSASKNISKASKTTNVTRRKQSKSRNGCTSCKAKRLKCDETKPTCKQCDRRGVVCGGYKKDFKWRPFEEPHLPGKSSGKPQRDLGLQTSTSAHSHFHDHTSLHNRQYAFANTPQDAYCPPLPWSHPLIHGPLVQTSFPQLSIPLRDCIYAVPFSSPFSLTPQSISPVDSYSSGHMVPQSLFRTESVDKSRTAAAESSTISSGQSPRSVDLLLPRTGLCIPPTKYSSFLSQDESFYQPTGLTQSAPIDQDIENLPHSTNIGPEAWVMRLPSPVLSNSGSSTDSVNSKLPAQIQSLSTSVECLTRRYDRDTCGVLSVKDGPTENPWRTFVWPLAHDCPALYHAITAMTCFHQSRDIPSMRIHGIDHMRSAVHALAAGLQNMRFDAAISTTLVLVFAESWDQHISTGINHIKGAKLLINQALAHHRRRPLQGEKWTRLKFLCNTWIYMDVIARLTSADDDETNDVDAVQESIYATGETETSIDPLMGCAYTLFPIIGRVANLVKRVRKTASNGPSIISQARKLRSQLKEWKPPSFIEDAEDETTSPDDSIKTAVAYQYATLLYLHQAVPEMPSQSSSALAKKVMYELAAVTPRSRSIIVHIYPLMAAGCEVTKQDDREWVTERWSLMSSRMKLGIVEKCLEVTKEVWNRRDEYIASCRAMEMDDMRNKKPSPEASIKRNLDVYLEDFEADGEFCWLDADPKRRNLDSIFSYSMPLSGPVFGDSPQWTHTSTSTAEWLEPECTVKSRLHWLAVMKDWEWEILLG